MNLLTKLEEYLLRENFEQAEQKFIAQGIDDKQVKDAIEKFKVQKKKAEGKEKDISYWVKKGFSEFDEFVTSLENKKTVREKRRNDKSDVIVVLNTPKVKIIIPKTEAAAIEYGQGTKWCTASKIDNTFKEYLHKIGHTLYYVIVKNGIDKKLMYNDKFVTKYHGNGLKGIQHGTRGIEDLLPEQQEIRELYMNVKPETYNRLAVLLRNETITPEMVADAKKRGGVPARLIQPFDIYDNFMKNSWFNNFMETYDVPKDTFTLRTKENEGKFHLKENVI